ncbi:MAG: DUF1826 domain-containing protein [Oligoflexales bacterium]
MANSFQLNQFLKQHSTKSSKHLISDQCVDLAGIYKDHIGLCIWTPPASEKRDLYAQQLAIENFQFKQLVSVDNIHENLEYLPKRLGFKAMQKWITELIDVFATLFGLDQVGLRISSQKAPICPRFHFDHVPARLIHSLYGDSCQWLDAPAFLQHENDSEVGIDIERQQSSQIKQAPSGSVVIMKGSKWKEDFQPVIHRSPMHNQARAVMTLDFA